MAGEIQLNGTTALTESGGVVTLNNVDSATNRTNLGLGYASTSEVQGTHTTFSGSHSDTATTINLASVSGISAGDYVVGEGIAPGTTVSSVSASSVVISAGLDTDGVGIAGGEPISFYKSTKALSPGLVAGGLCRAWVNFNGTGTVAIRAAYNVSSITDRGGSGLYTVNLTTAMTDANFSIVAHVHENTSTVGGLNRSVNGYPISTTAFYLNSYAPSTTSLIDVGYISAAIFR